MAIWDHVRSYGIAMHGLWSYMVKYGYVWSSIFMYGHACLYMVMHGKGRSPKIINCGG